MIDPVLLAESDRDQNVYLGRIFTRHLTMPLPTFVFLPDATMEVVEAVRWARDTATPVTVRGAASAALGGAVANDGGLVLDLARTSTRPTSIRPVRSASWGPAPGCGGCIACLPGADSLCRSTPRTWAPPWPAGLRPAAPG